MLNLNALVDRNCAVREGRVEEGVSGTGSSSLSWSMSSNRVKILVS